MKAPAATKQFSPVVLTLTCNRSPVSVHVPACWTAEIVRAGSCWAMQTRDEDGVERDTFDTLQDALRWFSFEVAIDQRYDDLKAAQVQVGADKAREGAARLPVRLTAACAEEV